MSFRRIILVVVGLTILGLAIFGGVAPWLVVLAVGVSAVCVVEATMSTDTRK